jgi:hypothetical protein
MNYSAQKLRIAGKESRVGIKASYIQTLTLNANNARSALAVQKLIRSRRLVALEAGHVTLAKQSLCKCAPRGSP